MTRSWVQTTPAQRQGVESESDHELRTPVGSESMAALRARRERPSEFREVMKGAKNKHMRHGAMCRWRGMLLQVGKGDEKLATLMNRWYTFSNEELQSVEFKTKKKQVILHLKYLGEFSRWQATWAWPFELF